MVAKSGVKSECSNKDSSFLVLSAFSKNNSDTFYESHWTTYEGAWGYVGIVHTVAEAVSCWPLTAEDWFCTQVSPCGICGGQSGTGTDFSLEFLGLPC
jgi:hypothetical protein